MVKLLIIADDFTGALDTGIQFVNKGIATQVFTKMPEAIGDIDETTEVLVIDSGTRRMPAAKAYDTVKNITGWAKAIKIPIIFKKTDSALRGNIGITVRNAAHFMMPDICWRARESRSVKNAEVSSSRTWYYMRKVLTMRL